MRTLLIATTNPGKLREIRALMPDVPVRLVSLADIPHIEEPEETGTTFEENARLKARYYAARSGLWTVAEDSGLVIDALDGEPGVQSARFLGPDATYPERFAEIYRRLHARGNLPRTARFVAALASVDGGEVVYETTGTVEGEIASAPSGAGGFGYDPIFFYPPYGKTLADVDAADKIAVAHRGVAFRKFAAWIKPEGIGDQGSRATERRDQ
ncbi:MAG TPA: RdgB/HAM1 family non-canonical purine NTP pyrophosphatase [Vicinamibacterales bacterium]|jgi:XTP/dITP diphosphohydrolase|nr:RdgB/HAM1 family non-canonical purine NTP pyrophosphatase [Vicinamibacterales bacterium]